MIISLDMYQTLFAAVCVLMLGRFLKARIGFLEKFCIPAPVIGGVLFAVFTCLCYVTGIAEFEFDDILKEVCMVFFFTSVGFQANLKVLKSGGKSLIIFLGLVVALILCQNFLAVGLADLLGISPLIGLCTGSIPMVGGHGTAGAFGPVLEDFGVAGATTLCTAAATYGLIAGSVMGGPTGRLLIERRKLLDTVVPEDDSLLVEEEIKHERHTSMYPAAVFQLIIAIGIGTFISKVLAMTGLTFPIYIGAMIAAACMRNIGEFTHKFTTHMGEINDIGGISLSLFLGIAMITLKLWQLAALALPLIILLAGQTMFMLQNVFQSFLITAEKPHFGLGVTVAAGLTNIILDFLFIAVFRWGLAGAAIATAASQFVGGGVPLLYFARPNRSLLRLGKTKLDSRALLKACTNGSSELMTNLSSSLVTVLYNFQLMQLAGEDGIAAYGVIMYVNFIFIAIFIGYSIGSAPVVGYHHGAGNSTELKSLFRKSLLLVGAAGVALTAAAEALALPLTRIFVGYDAALLAMTCRGFRLYSLSFLLTGFNIFSSGFFTALNDGFVSAVISFLRTLVFQTAVVLVLPALMGTDGIWLAIVVAELLALAVSAWFLWRKRGKYRYA